MLPPLGRGKVQVSEEGASAADVGSDLNPKYLFSMWSAFCTILSIARSRLKMELLARMLGGNDNNTYPYTYQAIVNILDEADDSMQVSYFADTICGLVAFLKKRHEDPSRTKILEIYQGEETPVPGRCYLRDDGSWLSRQELCYPMSSRYGEPGREGSCPFRGKSHAVI